MHADGVYIAIGIFCNNFPSETQCVYCIGPYLRDFICLWNLDLSFASCTSCTSAMHDDITQLWGMCIIGKEEEEEISVQIPGSKLPKMSVCFLYPARPTFPEFHENSCVSYASNQKTNRCTHIITSVEEAKFAEIAVHTRIKAHVAGAFRRCRQAIH